MKATRSSRVSISSTCSCTVMVQILESRPDCLRCGQCQPQRERRLPGAGDLPAQAREVERRERPRQARAHPAVADRRAHAAAAAVPQHRAGDRDVGCTSARPAAAASAGGSRDTRRAPVKSAAAQPGARRLRESAGSARRASATAWVAHQADPPVHGERLVAGRRRRLGRRPTARGNAATRCCGGSPPQRTPSRSRASSRRTARTMPAVHPSQSTSAVT